MCLRKGYQVWRDSCGYRQHVLVSNQLKTVSKKQLRQFQMNHVDACVLELPGLTLFATGGVPRVAEDVDIEIRSTGDNVLLELFPEHRDSVTAIKLKIRRMNADDTEILASPLGKPLSRLETEVVPGSYPLRISLSLKEPCVLTVRKEKEGEKP